MSTTENLVVRIQNGEYNLMPALWENVHDFITWRARQQIAIIGNRGGVEVNDLVNSGYFALIDAVRTYQPGKSVFLSWLSIHLKNSFSEATGFRTQAQKNDALRFAISLSTPLDDESGDVLGDILESPESTSGFDRVDEKIHVGQLRTALQEEIDRLTRNQAQVIRSRYFVGESYSDIGRRLNVSTSRAQQLEDEAMRELRKPESLRRLESFVEARTPYYLQSGPEAFQRTHTSAVEEIVFLREKLRRYGENRIMEEHKWM